MCIIAKGLKKDLRRAEIERCMETNPAGFFIAVLKKDPKNDVFIRTLERAPILAEYDHADPDDMIVTHSRIPSRGGMDANLADVHGWCEDGVRFCHNRTFSCLDAVMKHEKCEYMTDSEYFFRHIFMPVYRAEGRRLTPLVDRVVRAVAGEGNRLLFIFPDNTVVTYGPFVEDHGVLFSNESYRPAPQTLWRPAPEMIPASCRPVQPLLPMDLPSDVASELEAVAEEIARTCPSEALRLVAASPAVFGARLAMAQVVRGGSDDAAWAAGLADAIRSELPEAFGRTVLDEARAVFADGQALSDDDFVLASADVVASMFDSHAGIGSPSAVAARILARLKATAASSGIFVDPSAASASRLVEAFAAPSGFGRRPRRILAPAAFAAAGFPDQAVRAATRMLRLARSLKAKGGKSS